MFDDSNAPIDYRDDKISVMSHSKHLITIRSKGNEHLIPFG